MTDPTSIFDPRVRAATVTILLLVALSAFEGLAVVAALPDVAADLGGVALLPWVITIYLLAAGVATVAAGALVDRFGVTPVFRAAVVVFVVGGLLAGIAPTMPILVSARFVQGTGAGAVNAVGLAAVGLVYPRALVGRAFAANSTVWGVMSVAGPAITALLLTIASWRWIFLVNLPLGAIALVFGWRALPTRQTQVGGARLNALNLALLTTFTFLSLVAVDALDWRSVPAALASLGAAWWVLRRNRGKRDALIAPRHVLDAPLGPLGWTVALLLIGAIGTSSYVPLFVSGGRGVGAVATAWSVLFFVIGWTSGANISSRLMDRRTPLDVMTGGASIVVPSLVGVAVAASAAPLWLLFVLLYLAGAGMGTTTNSALTLVQLLVADDELGRATAAHQFIRNQGFAIGNALVGAVLLLVVARTTGDVEAVRDVLGDTGRSGADIAGTAIAGAIRQGFAVAVGAGAGVAALAFIPLARLRAMRDDLPGMASDREPLPMEPEHSTTPV